MPSYGSLFAGVGGFDMGFDRAGYECRFQVEWDKNCQNILNRHWPEVPKWGDVCEVDGATIPPVDVLIFGSPCQDLSVAGKRAGLDGARSGLFFEAMRIVREMRDATANTFPRVVVWENVVGALNSNGGADFGAVLDQMAEAGALVVEWAVLDAQHFGVPQRRRRVFVVAVLDSSAAGKCPDPLLPVGEGVRRDSAKGRKKRQAAAAEVAAGVGGGGWGGVPSSRGEHLVAETFGNPGYARWVDTDTATTLSARDYKGSTTLVGQPYTGSDYGKYVEGVGVLRANGGDIGGGSESIVVEPFTKSRRAQTSDDDETWVPGEVAPTLNQFDVGDTRTTTAIVEPLSFDTQFGSNANVFADQSPTLKASQQPPSVTTAVAYDEYNDRLGSDVHHALRAGTKQSTGVVDATMTVRRLTPVECERLMGWPDDHTRWKADGTEQADTHRYKQCGNGVATPVAQWIAGHLLPILATTTTTTTDA